MSDGGKSRSSSSFHFLAGLSSGVLSAVLLQPADLLKTRVQQSRSTTLSATLTNILRGPDPVRSLWRGTVPSALRTGFGSALYFTTLNALRTSVAKSEEALMHHHRNNNPTTTHGGGLGEGGGGNSSSSSSSLVKLSRLGNLVTGAVARASAGLVMMPVTVIKVRFESSYYAYPSLWAAGADIRRTHGARGFFAGFGATAVRDAPYAGLYVLFYEESKKALGRVAGVAAAGSSASGGGGGGGGGDDVATATTMGGGEAAAVNFASGVVAAGAGTALTNPFDAIKTRLQLLPDRYANMAHAARLMLREEGVGSLFDGLGLRMARKALSSALAWTLYEELIRRAERRFVASEEAVMKG